MKQANILRKIINKTALICGLFMVGFAKSIWSSQQVNTLSIKNNMKIKKFIFPVLAVLITALFLSQNAEAQISGYTGYGSHYHSLTQASSNASNNSVCPTIDQLKEKWQGGCYTCLIIENMISTFLSTASTAYGITQSAGIVVLGIGAVLWMLMWGLKNLSSLTAIISGNILSDLIKMLFKIMVAYIFIKAGMGIVISYFVSPIMGAGAVIAEQFWSSKNGLKSSTEAYVWDNITDENYAEIAAIEKQAIAETEKTPLPEKGKEGTPPTETETTVTKRVELSAEDQKLLELADRNTQNFTAEEIPNFIIPACFEGHLTSPVGCRIPPAAGASSYHLGLDIGTSGKTGGAVVASGPGTITYRTQTKNGKVTGAGYYAIIVHDNKWTSRYFHMLPNSSSSFGPSGKKVRQGEQIGYIGNSGVGTGAHLHFEIMYKGQNVDPLRLLQKQIVVINKSSCTGKNVATFPEGYSKGMKIPAKAWTAGGKGFVDLTSTYITSTGGSSGSSGGSGSATMDYSAFILPPLGEIKYTGPTNILPKSVINSILGATNAITNNVAESMVLGNALTCFAVKEAGGAWKLPTGAKWVLGHSTFPNLLMWLEGAIIWTCGFMLTLAVGYYLLDMCFKLGFAVIALPLVIGLWPFNMTKGKFMICMSIIFKSAATFAFLAITTNYAMELISSAFGGMTELYEHLDTSGGRNEANIDYVNEKLAIFGTYFILILFAYVYSFKLISSTIESLVNKFFPDNAFGNANPMHQWATAATKYVKDKAMAPVGLARDIATHQTGRLAKNLVGNTAKTLVGRGTGNNAAGNVTKATGKATKFAGKVAQGFGKGTQAAGKALNAIPVVGTAVGGVVSAVGKGVETAGNLTEKAGEVIDKAGDKVNEAGRYFTDKKEKESDEKK